MKRMIHNKYEVEKLLGTGAMGNVYLARDLHLERLVAIKEMDRTCTDKKEMQFLIQLKHVGLPEIYDYFEEEDRCFMIMEFVDGMTLKQYLEKHGKAELMVCIDWMKQLAEILRYLHDCHPAVIYRDLKPSNVMITPHGQVKLIDLGGAFRREYNAKEDKMCVGTPAYSAPEQWKGAHVEKTCDIFGFGAIFHELLTGASPQKPPYERHPIRQYDRSLPIGLEEMILHCLKEDPGQRYSSMGEVLRELEQYQKAGRKKRILFELKRLLLGLLVVCSVIRSVLPLIHGISGMDFPFPYLMTPIKWMTLSCVCYLLFFRIRRKKRYMIRQEKDIWLTEKKGFGLLLLFVFLMGNFCMALIGNGTLISAASGEKNSLWVDMKDGQNRKILVREGTVFSVSDRLVFELDAQELPIEPVSMQLIAFGSDGKIYESRMIRVVAEK